MSMLEALKPLPAVDGTAFDRFVEEVEYAHLAQISKAESTLRPLFNSSPYLTDIASKNVSWLSNSLMEDADQVYHRLLNDLRAVGESDTKETDLSFALRQTKSRLALWCAIAETGGVWTPRQSTAALAELADVGIEASLNFLMREACEKGLLTCKPGEANAASSGLAIFALGKHGGRELNYSSDIDIVAFYDSAAPLLADPPEANKFYTRLVRNMVALMEERTEYGYVFRTDLRLRPDPGSTPVALSTDAALTYYEARGQNWERAAWIKARACAGDMKVAKNFLKELAPFIWRKHLDFATIADIQAMKRQINIARKVGKARVEGHNVKLGRGGIREVEFFTQTQQLIAGGRDPDLRVKPTVEALEALANAGWIAESTASELTDAYWYLRAVENRLQMLRDEQTHSMPESTEDVQIIGRLMGEENLEAFKKTYRETLSTVMGYYAELFIEGETLASDTGDLVFTGSEDDPGTLETLSRLGFQDPVKVSEIVRKWHYGSYAATRASAARAQLTEFLPRLLTILTTSGNADEALMRFDHFLSRFPSGVQLFALLRSNAQLCHMLVAFMSSAPRMAEAVIHRAHVVDGLIDPAFADGVTRRDILVEKVDDFLGQTRGYEDLIDRARIIGQEQKFLISAGFLSGTVNAAGAGDQFSTLAETLLGRLFAAVREEFARRHGVIQNAETCLLGFGKLASREMTGTSDLDFILMYNAPQDAESNGEKPLDTTRYFARLTQRLVAALSAPTAEGVLYEADMRLRPSGNAGPLATSLNGFSSYQRENAWTWERMALSRARVVVGDEGLKEEVEEVIAATLSADRDKVQTIADVLDMRERLAKERKPRHPFDLKLAKGGLIDIEFVAQSAQLVEGTAINAPQAPVRSVLSRLHETGLLPRADRLLEVHQTYATILQAMSVCLTNPFSDEAWTGAFKDLLAELTNYPDFQRLEADLSEMAKDVSEIAADWYARYQS